MEEGHLSSTTSLEKLHEKLIRKNKELDILGEIFSQIRGSMDLDAILNLILRQLDHYFGFHHSMILLKGKGNFLKVVASYGYEVTGIGAKVEIGKGVIGTAAKRKKLVRMGNINLSIMYVLAGEAIENTENEIIIKLPGLQKPRSQVAIPMLNKEELIGVLTVESDRVNLFKEEDEQIISLISNQAAIVIEQARMYDMERQRFQEIEQINSKLSELTQAQQNTLNLFIKYVPESIVKKALSGHPDLIFEGELREVALLFCDIRDFTSVSERLTPSQVVTVLNTFYSRMNDVIRKNQGVINQYIGDEVFVIFGAPVTIVNCEERAVCCAIGMIEQVALINKELKEILGVSISVGIGVHCGPVVTGNLGCEDKISYSVTGDVVNTAKRIESLTKDKPDSILVSDQIYSKVAHLVEANERELVNVKGKLEKLKVWEVVGVKRNSSELHS